MTGRRLLVLLGAVIAALAAALVLAFQVDDRELAPPVDADRASRLLGSLGPGVALDGAMTWRPAAIDGSRVRLVLSDRPTPSGPELAVIELTPLWWQAEPPTPAHTSHQGYSYLITTWLPPDADQLASAHIADALQHLQRTDNGRFYAERPLGYWLAPPFELAFLLFLLAVWLGVTVRRRGTDVSATTHLKATHLIVAGLHVTFLTYWGLHWDGVLDYLPIILTQLVFAYLADAAIALHTDGRWTLTFGPVPIVGSTSLFVWFRGLDVWLGFLVIFIALATKAWMRRDGRHIFNPSAIGITVAALLCLAAPGLFNYIDISAALNFPPNMLEVILLTGLVAQLRVPVVMTSICAYGVMYLLWTIGLRGEQVPFWPSVFLAITLLVTDPVTSPRTGAGRALFGIAYGLGVSCFDLGLSLMGASTFFAKVLPVPIVNWFVPWFDARGARLDQRLRESVLPARLNRAHIVVWLLLVVGTFAFTGVKQRAFLPEQQLAEQTRLIQTDWRGAASCDNNPVYCQPFSFAQELRLWTSR